MNTIIFYIILILWGFLMIVWGTLTIKTIVELYLYLQGLATKKEKTKPIKKNVTKRISRTTRKV